MKNTQLKLTTAAMLTLGASCLQGSVISIDFDTTGSTTYSGSATTPSGMVPLAGQAGTWNSLEVGAGGLASTTASPFINGLLDGDGTATAVGFEFNTGGGTYISFSDSAVVLDSLGYDTVTIWDTFSTDTSIAFEFSGLQASQSYDIRIFGQTQGDGATAVNPVNHATFTIGGDAETTTIAQNYVDFTVVSDGFGIISGSLDQLTNFSSMSGIQIEGTVIPEPSSMALLLGLGSLFFVGLRRRA
jgi:hypothetical protein